MNLFAILLGKLIALCLRIFNSGSATALPGLIALKINPLLCPTLCSQFKKGIIIVSGTNGKTTTTSLIAKILSDQKFTVVHNTQGSNLLRGIASVLIRESNPFGRIKADWGIFEVDEAALPEILIQLQPKIVIFTNLFRDQLDRYGEIDTLAQKWHEALSKPSPQTKLILNADDPVIAGLNRNLELPASYFGISDLELNTKTHHHADSIFCPICLTRLNYTQCFYSHLGRFYCSKCQYTNPKLNLAASKISLERNKQKITLTNSEPGTVTTSLMGIYNVYNILAVYLAADQLHLNLKQAKKSIQEFEPAFGRQEKIKIEEKSAFILLSKNPTGFTQSLEAIAHQNPKNILLALNDKIADGEDVSWIADVDFQKLPLKNVNLTISGTRAYDLALRLKYELSETDNYTFLQDNIEPDLRRAIFQALEKLPAGETLYILPTYTAMLEVRRILTGKQLI